MSSHIDDLFSSSVQEAVALTAQQQKPLFVYLTKSYQNQEESGNEFLSKFIDEEITQVLHENFVLLKLIEHTPEFGYFTQLFKDIQLPSFYIVNLGKIEGVITNETDKRGFTTIIQRLVNQRSSSSLGTNENNTSQLPSNTPTPTPTSDNSHSQPNTTVNATAPISSSSSTPEINRRTSVSEHDISAQKYKEQVEKARREKLEEKKRLRALLEADKRERELRLKEELETHVTEDSTSGNLQESAPATSKLSSPSATTASSCVLSIKLFDGSTVKQEFKAEDTLSDVRKWLDSEIEIIQPTGSMPSFATSAHLHPTSYVFHRPILPRVTYLEEQESLSLKDLELTPRSALILKPIYDEADPSSPSAGGERTGFFGNIMSGVGKVGSALFAFFDYGVDAPYLQEQHNQQQQHHEDQQEQEQQQQQQHEERMRRNASSHSSNDDFENSQTFLPDSQPFGLGNPGPVAAPGVLTFDNRSASSLLINIESNTESDVNSIISRPHTPSHMSSDGPVPQRPLMAERGSRSSTPRAQSSRRIQTIHDESIETSSSNKDKKHIDTYNGNSLSLNEGDDENKKQNKSS